MKIFVSIASYRDTEITKTLKSALSNARYPKDLNFSVLTQDIPKRHPNLDFVPNLNHLQMNYKDAKGAGYARKILMDEYDGEDFFFQTDSHMRFAPNWDVRMITMTEQAKDLANTEKIILSQFPAPYKVFTNGKDHFPEQDNAFWTTPSWTSVVRTYNHLWAGNREFMSDKTKPCPSWTVLAGYIFAPGNIVEEVPYDERISFMGEELCFAVRAYTRGWKIYAPHEMLLWHYYSRKGHPKVWTQRDDSGREISWREREEESFRLQKEILTGVEKGIYGVGDQKLYRQYQKMIGINFKKFYEKETENVGGRPETLKKSRIRVIGNS
jgi:glycosyltransferase involved in cell wall biosynthesis